MRVQGSAPCDLPDNRLQRERPRRGGSVRPGPLRRAHPAGRRPQSGVREAEPPGEAARAGGSNRG
eukprot:9744833-Alexandrium_andersonii.AAC.1